MGKMDAIKTSQKGTLVLFAAALAVAMAMMVPLAYLFVRTAGGGRGVLDIVFSPRTYRVLTDSGLMALTVTALSALIAVPLAFLSVRTDLPLRRFWSIATVMPLVIPSYVGSYAVIAALGPRGSLVQKLLEPYGVDMLPSIYGWPGTILVLTLFSYPYILLTVRSSLHLMDP